MEHPFILDYIKQRMTELGHEKYHFEAVKVNWDYVRTKDPNSNIFYNVNASYNAQFSADKFYVISHNEYYFITEKTAPQGLRIVSDSGVLNLEDQNNYANYTFFNYKEFTGQIFFEITNGQVINLEFIKVTPYGPTK